MHRKAKVLLFLILLASTINASSLSELSSPNVKFLQKRLDADFSVVHRSRFEGKPRSLLLSDIAKKLSATETFHRRETIGTAALIGGEALAIGMGLGLFADEKSNWLDSKNAILLTSDLIIGSGIIYLCFRDKKLHESKWYWILTAVSFATHLYRQYEYELDGANAFCDNPGLRAINSIKLSGVIASGTTGLMLRIDFGFGF